MELESDCISIDDSLAFVAGELDVARSSTIEAHLEQCAECRAFVVHLARTDEPPADDAPLLGAGDRVHRYDIIEPIGAGGMGIVYAAWDPALERRIALKMVRPHAVGAAGLARLGREAATLAQLSHPHVVAIYDIVQERGRLAIAMELVEGARLDAWLATARPHWREVVRAFVGIGDGLAAAHAVGIVHRDIKPSNILVGHDGRARIGDFGIARRRADAERTGELTGTPAFMAPEQRRGEEATAASDQYALCLALYWSLWHERPSSDAPIEPPSTPRVPARLRAAIVRGLQNDASQRWPSMRELVDVLRRPDPTWRRPVALAGAVACVGALAFMWGSATTQPSSSRCSRDGALAGWNDQVRADLRLAIADASVAEPLVDGLDGYARALAIAGQDACAAARDPADPRQLHARFGCLRERERLFHHVVGELIAERADPTQSSWPLLDPEQCAAPEAWLSRQPLPALATDAELDAIADARADLLAARMSFGWGELARGNALLDDVGARPIVREFPPLESELLWTRSNLMGSLADSSEDAATAMRFRVVASATATRHDWIAAMAWIELADWAGPDRAAAYAGIARSHVEALGEGDPNLPILLAQVEARAFRLDGELERAREVLEGVLASTDDLYWRADTLADLAVIAEARGDFATAIARGDEAIATADHVTGQPLLWHMMLRTQQATRMSMAGRRSEAQALARATTATADEASLGPFGMGYVLLHLAIIELVTGEAAAARTAAAAASDGFARGGGATSLVTLADAIGLAARIATGDRGDPALARVIAADMDREPRDEVLSPLDRLTCRMVVALAAVPTSPDRATRMAAVQRAAEEIPRWELAETHRDPLFAWLRETLVRESPDLVAPIDEILHRDGDVTRPPP